MTVCTVRERVDVRYDRRRAAYGALNEDTRLAGYGATAAEFVADARPSRTVYSAFTTSR
jgi:hypothetical protein